MEDDTTKLIATGVLAAGVGGFGGHTIGTEGEQTTVNAATLEQCSAFIVHAQRHERDECELEKLELKIQIK